MGLIADLRKKQDHIRELDDAIIEIGEEKIREAEAWKSSKLHLLEMLDEDEDAQAFIDDALLSTHGVVKGMDKISSSEDVPDTICILQEPDDSLVASSADSTSDFLECAATYDEIDLYSQADEEFVKEADQLDVMLENIF